jgi:hypothetical protein
MMTITAPCIMINLALWYQDDKDQVNDIYSYECLQLVVGPSMTIWTRCLSQWEGQHTPAILEGTRTLFYVRWHVYIRNCSSIDPKAR